MNETIPPPPPVPMTPKQEELLLETARRMWGYLDGPVRLDEFRKACGGSPTSWQASQEIGRIQARIKARAAARDSGVPGAGKPVSRTATPPAPMSPKQAEHILRLAGKMWGGTEAPERLDRFRKECGGSPTAQQASDEITRILGLLKAKSAVTMSVSQTALIRRLAQEILGDGQNYLEKIAFKYGGTVSSLQASAEIQNLYSLKAGARPTVTGKDGRPTTSAPPGRYSVQDSEGTPTIVEVTKPTEGSWAGHTFVKKLALIPGGGENPVRGLEAIHTLNEIEKDPLVAANNYGRMTRKCGQCKRSLNDPQSIGIGIHPDCWGVFFD